MLRTTVADCKATTAALPRSPIVLSWAILRAMKDRLLPLERAQAPSLTVHFPVTRDSERYGFLRMPVALPRWLIPFYPAIRAAIVSGRQLTAAITFQAIPPAASGKTRAPPAQPPGPA